MTSFLIDGNTALKHYFIDADHHSSNGKSAVRLYKIDEIYDQIESIVENVSYDDIIVSVYSEHKITASLDLPFNFV